MPKVTEDLKYVSYLIDLIHLVLQRNIFIIIQKIARCILRDISGRCINADIIMLVCIVYCNI